MLTSNRLTPYGGLTAGAGVRWVQRVPKLRQFLVVVFALTIWFGASQHCHLEAAGLLTHGEHDGGGCCARTAPDCHADNCDLVEDATYRAAESAPVVLAPAIVECDWLTASAWLASPPRDALPVSDHVVFRTIPPWVPSWHQSRRTVALPGAPSASAA